MSDTSASLPVHRHVKGGLFITFEGVDCSGKSTQVKLLSQTLRRDGYDVLETREPGGTELGERLRDVLKHGIENEAVCDQAELFLFCASRVQLVRNIIQPHLEKDGVVICDRFADSTTAYQGYGRGFDLHMIEELHQIATCGRWPDLTFMLDLTVEQMEQRGQMRLDSLVVQDRFEDESRDYREAVRQGYLELARRYPRRMRLIDANESRETIQRMIREIVDHALA